MKNVLAVLLLCAPVAALAQDYDAVQQTPLPTTYATLAAGTSVSAGATITLPFAFSMYGQPIGTLEFSQHGFLTPNGTDTDSFNTGIPTTSSSAPTIIAPWWDSLTGATLRYQVFGSAPNRSIAFEWANVASSAATTVRTNFQAILYEGTNAIRFIYGANQIGSGTASVGVQRGTGVGVSALSACTTPASGICGTANFPSNQVIDITAKPELSIPTVTLDNVGYAGVAFRGTVTVANTGGRATPSAGPVSVRLYLSSNATYEATDTQIADTAAAIFPANAQTLVQVSTVIPVATAQGTYFVLTKVDPDTVVIEGNEDNNFGPPTQITVAAPLPDLVVTAVTAPATAMPGQMLTVGRTFSNAGNADAPGFKYTWFLSNNAVVTTSDLVLGAAMTHAGLAAGATVTATDSVTLPAVLAAGPYWLGVCANYDPAAMPQFGLEEVSQVNDCKQVTTATVISSGQLVVTTPMMLPTATQLSPYGGLLSATGGNGQYSWRVSSGMLPAGTQIVGNHVQGTPQAAGTFDFVVEVSSGGATATAMLQLQVSMGNIALTIVDQDLPAAEFGHSYATHLYATGGKPPYRWNLKPGTTVPTQLALSEDGDIEGIAQLAGEFTFGVEVVDSAMTRVSKDLKIRVVKPSTLHVATTRLSPATLKAEYTQELIAVGGKAPYTWTIDRFRQLPLNATEKPGDVLLSLPTDFGIRIDDAVTDFLRGVPTVAGRYVITFRVTDAASATDFTTLLLDVTYNDPIAITTTALPDAFVGHDYSAKLSHNRGRESTGVKFTVPCVIAATDVDKFECAPIEATQNLPPGLALAEDGSITGMPLTSGDSADGTSYSFLVKVTDDAGRQDVRSLSILLRPNFEVPKSGCSGTAAAPSLIALLALAAIRRKRVRL